MNFNEKPSAYDAANALANTYKMTFRLCSILVHCFNFEKTCAMQDRLAILTGIRNLINAEIEDFKNASGISTPTPPGPVPFVRASPHQIITKENDPQAVATVQDKIDANKAAMPVPVIDTREWRYVERDEHVGPEDESYCFDTESWDVVDGDWPGKPAKNFPTFIRTRNQSR